MKRFVLLLAASLLLLAGCGSGKREREKEEPAASGSYRQISQEEALRMMEEETGYVILDVRRADEFEAGHIPNALLIPNESIEDVPPAQLPDKEQLILIYCRSGNRSKQAAQKLADMGYVNVCEFGGINTWPGEIVTGE
ncbi:MAG: rhodanese-like domain-containing protein [Oscillospiraceae bacterium]|nr:rhodanese-like domain-containing protein [Oscillospiraceae bacterium]